MQFFIGVVPPVEVKNSIIEFQTRWKNNSLLQVVEPHITIKAQGGLTPDKNWVSEVEKVCLGISPFQVTLDKPMFFGENVLFFNVQSEQIQDVLEKLVRTISPEPELIKKYMEFKDYVPHLTLGQTNWGLSAEELKEMAKAAEQVLFPHPAFNVNFLRIYQETQPNKYSKYLDLSLLKNDWRL
jgi:2'-5' RNA ligase